MAKRIEHKRTTPTKGLSLRSREARDWISHVVTFQPHKIRDSKRERENSGLSKGHGWFFCASTIFLRIRFPRSASFYIILRTRLGMTRTKPQRRRSLALALTCHILSSNCRPKRLAPAFATPHFASS